LQQQVTKKGVPHRYVLLAKDRYKYASGNKQRRKYLTAAEWLWCNFFLDALFEICWHRHIDGSFFSARDINAVSWIFTAFITMHKIAPRHHYSISLRSFFLFVVISRWFS
jgi:hypothetical protein